MSDSRRIAFCITDLDAGGAERALVQIVTRLAQEDWSPKVFCLSGSGELAATLQSAGVPVECFGATSSRSLGVIRRLAGAIHAWRPQLVQTFMFHANLAGRFAAWRAGVPIVVSGLRVAERDAPWRMRADRWTQRFVTTNVAVSQGVADFAANEVGIAREKLTVIPNGVDFERFDRATAADLDQFGIPPGSRVVTCIGRLHPQKAPEILIEACSPAFESNPDLHLLLVGDGPLRSTLEQLSHRLGLNDRIHIVGRQPETAGLLKSSTVCVLPSRWEGMPNVLLEAMASGCPVIASNVEGSRELIAHNVGGRLFPVDDVAALRAEITWNLEHRDEVRRMADAAQQTVQKGFGWARVTVEYNRLYSRLLDSAPGVNNLAGA